MPNQNPKDKQPPPDFQLLHTLRGHEQGILEMAWSPDGRTLASASSDGAVRLWGGQSGELHGTLKGHKNVVVSVAWSPDGKTLASGSRDKTIRLWDGQTGSLQRALEGHGGEVNSVAWSPDSRTLASASHDYTIRLWDRQSGQLRRTLKGHDSYVLSVAWSPDGSLLASASLDKTIRTWDSQSGQPRQTLTGHSDWVISLAWSPNNRTLASGSRDQTIGLWDAEAGRQARIVEGHTGIVTCVRFSPDGHLLVSKSDDNTVKLWRCDTWEPVAVLDEATSGDLGGLAFHPNAPILATLGEKDHVIRIWHLEYKTLLGAAPTAEAVHYTTAKIALVGDSGVGKTGLGWRLAHGEYKEHSSTYGQQFWPIDELGTTRTDGTECEAILWDLAGQPDYRLVHSLFLDDVDLALVLFDPTNREKPLGGVEFWLKQLARRQERSDRTILVGARIDRGVSTLTPSELATYCRQQGISGDYIATSAKTGQGLPELMQQIKSQVVWDEMPATVTTRTFKRIKEYVLSLKEEGQRAGVLVSPAKLRQQLQQTDPDWEFSDAEMMTAAGHLATHGYVTVLRGASGRRSILLRPDLLANLAASIVLEARRSPRGLGVLEEAVLLRGGYPFPELANLTEAEREILLDAATVLFLAHNLRFRETFNEQIFRNRSHPLYAKARCDAKVVMPACF